MKKIHYNKLIRDKIPERIKKDGAEFRIRRLGKREFEIELLKKVEEEASALPKAKNQQELIAELADVADVIDEIKTLKKITSSEIKKKQKMNFIKKGGFKKKLYLYWTTDSGYKTNEIRRKKNKI
jgi:predicted house-cleaning noncanonical NTP pyrophosphatase (MazG superfamily)